MLERDPRNSSASKFFRFSIGRCRKGEDADAVEFCLMNPAGAGRRRLRGDMARLFPALDEYAFFAEQLGR